MSLKYVDEIIYIHCKIYRQHHPVHLVFLYVPVIMFSLAFPYAVCKYPIFYDAEQSGKSCHEYYE